MGYVTEVINMHHGAPSLTLEICFIRVWINLIEEYYLYYIKIISTYLHCMLQYDVELYGDVTLNIKYKNYTISLFNVYIL